jgi:hypothetical protein
MKHYSLKLKLWDDKITDEKTDSPKVYPRANGDLVSNSEGYLSSLGHQGKIFFESYVDDAPIFDYFYLYSSTYQKEYDWILLDAYNFIGQNIPNCRGFLVSKRFKDIVEKFQIAKPFRFYESKLQFQGEKLEYFILHLAQNEWNNINSSKTKLYNNDLQVDTTIHNNRELKNLIKQYPEIRLNIVLKDFSDLFYFGQFGYIVSERLKEKMEESSLKDFEFIELENVAFEIED